MMNTTTAFNTIVPVYGGYRGGLCAGIYSMENFVLKEGGEMSPWRNLGGSAA